MKLRALPLLLTMIPAVAAAEPSAGYQAEADNNTVTICPHLRNDRACPQPEGMLRQNVETGEVVRLAQNCTNRRSPGDAHVGACYIDECVPKGTYRYGYARPLECVGSSTFYYAQVTVTGEPAKDCQHSGGAGPVAATRVPWGEAAYVCVGGCGTELARLPRLSWGLILLLLAGTSLIVLYQRYGRRQA